MWFIYLTFRMHLSRILGRVLESLFVNNRLPTCVLLWSVRRFYAVSSFIENNPKHIQKEFSAFGVDIVYKNEIHIRLNHPKLQWIVFNLSIWNELSACLVARPGVFPLESHVDINSSLYKQSPILAKELETHMAKFCFKTYMLWKDLIDEISRSKEKEKRRRLEQKQIRDKWITEAEDVMFGIENEDINVVNVTVENLPSTAQAMLKTISKYDYKLYPSLDQWERGFKSAHPEMMWDLKAIGVLYHLGLITIRHISYRGGTLTSTVGLSKDQYSTEYSITDRGRQYLSKSNPTTSNT